MSNEPTEIVDKLILHISQSLLYIEQHKFENTLAYRLWKGKIKKEDKKCIKQAKKILLNMDLYINTGDCYE